MREIIKKYRKIIIAILVLWIMFCLVYGGMLWREMLIFNRGSELLSLGDYAGAKTEFEKIGETEKIAECEREEAYAYNLSRLDRAKAMMDEGLLEEAKAELVILGDFENAAEVLLECEYRRAKKMLEEGNAVEALPLAKRLDAHPDAAELVVQAQELIYQQAVAAAYECRLDEAMELFGKIWDYKDSENYYRRCSERIVRLSSDWAEPVKYSENAGMDLGSGTLYWHRLGLIYVPHDCNAETTAMIFYPGGYDSSLANGYVTEYLYGTYGELPNSIMLFCYANGYGDMLAKAEDAYGALEQAAMENNVFLHDIALIGASMGAYTACRTAVWLYENEGIEAKYVITLDAGGHWAASVPILTTGECDIAAEAGTEFYLVEAEGIGMNVLAIQTMVAHGMDVTIARVRDYGHYSVIYDAMEYGIFNWAMGQGERPVHDNYRYIHLDKNSTYPN